MNNHHRFVSHHTTVIKHAVLVATCLYFQGCDKFENPEQAGGPIQHCGESAREKIFRGIPGSHLSRVDVASNREAISNGCAWVEGSVFGSVIYFTYTCDNEDSCWKTLEKVAGVSKNEFVPWDNPTYTATLQGPLTYWSDVLADAWPLAKISNGMKYEFVTVANDSHQKAGKADSVAYLLFCAVDNETHRVFVHYETGKGFMDRIIDQ